MTSVNGQVSSYDGSGFVRDLDPKSRDNYIQAVNELRDNLWVDAQTRAVIVSLGSMVLLLGAAVCCRRRCGDDGNCMTMEVRPPAEPSKRWHSIEENTSGVERERNEP